jgi:hypothetical protein
MTLDTPPGIRALEGEHQLAPYKISAAQAHRPLTWTRSEGLEPPAF